MLSRFRCTGVEPQLPGLVRADAASTALWPARLEPAGDLECFFRSSVDTMEDFLEDEEAEWAVVGSSAVEPRRT